jgi:hypothetical protein
VACNYAHKQSGDEVHSSVCCDVKQTAEACVHTHTHTHTYICRILYFLVITTDIFFVILFNYIILRCIHMRDAAYTVETSDSW